jgi:hypothetical protein
MLKYSANRKRKKPHRLSLTLCPVRLTKFKPIHTTQAIDS